MPTFQVTCDWCGQEKWPTLPERPTKYTCVLCTAVPPEKRVEVRERKRKAGERLVAHNRKARAGNPSSPDTTSPGR